MAIKANLYKANLQKKFKKNLAKDSVKNYSQDFSSEKLAPGLASLKKWFQKSNLPLTDQQYKQVWQYHTMIRDKNAEYDLTRVYQFDNMVQKHYIDCILVARLLDWQLPSPLLDIGTGAGFPAIPLKIVCPQTEFILSEGRHKRVKFLHEVIEALGLKKIEIYGQRINASFNLPVQGVITRAVESISETLAKIKNSLAPGGKAIFMKGPHCDQELQEALQKFKHSYKLNQDIAYTIPYSSHQRRLVVFERLEPIEPLETKETSNRIHEIESEANPVFKGFKALLTPRGIKKRGQALVFGRKIIQEIEQDYPELCFGLILSPKGKGLSEDETGFLPRHDARSVDNSTGVTPMGVARGFPESYKSPNGEGDYYYQLSSVLYNELDIFGIGSDILIVNIPFIEQWEIPETADLKANIEPCTLMIPFQDPENLGTVVRTAAAFGIKEIVLLQEAAYPYHPKSIRSGGSSIFRVRFKNGPSIHELQSMIEGSKINHVPIIPLSMEGVDIEDFHFPDQFILLPGVEGPGLPPKLRSHSVAIKTDKDVESLNAATATAIALYEWRKKRREKHGPVV